MNTLKNPTYVNFYSGLFHTDLETQIKLYSTVFVYTILNQIKILTAFYFNQLIILSASTGAGKSRQIPRMMLYFNVAFGHNTSRIACTQPTLKAI
jgi:hypothetical protein